MEEIKIVIHVSIPLTSQPIIDQPTTAIAAILNIPIKKQKHNPAIMVRLKRLGFSGSFSANYSTSNQSNLVPHLGHGLVFFLITRLHSGHLYPVAGLREKIAFKSRPPSIPAPIAIATAPQTFPSSPIPLTYYSIDAVFYLKPQPCHLGMKFRGIPFGVCWTNQTIMFYLIARYNEKI